MIYQNFTSQMLGYKALAKHWNEYMRRLSSALCQTQIEPAHKQATIVEPLMIPYHMMNMRHQLNVAHWQRVV
jgi:hypothetical protein